MNKKTALTLTIAMVSAMGAATPQPAQATTQARKISAYFVTAKPTVPQNTTLLRTMKADAITFGYRVKPAPKSTFPTAVQKVIGSKRTYLYTGGGTWNPKSLKSTDRTIKVGTVTWTVMNFGTNAVISSNKQDSAKALTEAGNKVGARTIIGVPAPQMRADTPWLPDMTYSGVLTEFTKRFAIDALAEGADGFYQHVEMPMTNTAYWAPVRNLYSSSNAALASVKKGVFVIESPYLESRRAKAEFTPKQAASGAKMLLATAKGTNLVIAPQDGLGAGTTALSADRRTGFVAPTESYLKAARSAVGSKLWVNIEMMKPKGTARTVTTRSRVSQQLWTESLYVTKSIGFMWDDSSRRIGAAYVAGLSKGELSAGFGTTR